MKLRRALRWLRRIVLGSLALVVLAILAVVIVLHTSWGRDLIRRKVEAALVNTFPNGATIGRLEGSPFGELIAYDIEIDGADHKPFAKIGAVKLKLALMPLISKTARLDELVIEDVVVTPGAPLKTPEQVAAAEAKARREPPEPSSWTIELPSIEVHRASVVVRGVDPVFGVASNLELSGHAAMPAGQPITAIVGLDATWHGSKLSAMAAAKYDGALALPIVTVKLDDSAIVAVDVAVALAPKLEIVRGNVIGRASKRDVANLVPTAVLPADATFAAVARGDLDDVFAAVGSASVRAFARLELAKRSAVAVLSVVAPDLAVLDRDKLSGSASLMAALGLSLGPDGPSAHGLLTVEAAVAGQPITRAIVAIDGGLAGGRLLAGASSEAGMAGAIVADVKRDADGIWVLRSHAIASASELALKAGHATVHAELEANGPVWPKPNVHVTGHVGASRIRYGAVAVRDIAITLDAKSIPSRPEADLRAVISDAKLGATRITALGFTSHGIYASDSGDLSATVVTNEIGVGAIIPGFGGHATAKLTVVRKAGVWTGDVTARANELVVVEGQPAVDVGVDAKLRGRRVTANVALSDSPNGTADRIGSATVALDVTGPADLLDIPAWRGLGRDAINSARVTITHLDGAKLGVHGQADGELHVSAREAGGQIEVHGVEFKGHSATANITLGTAPVGLTTKLAARVDDVVNVQADLELALPGRIFDPVAWRALGTNVLSGGTVAVEEVKIDPALLARYKVELPFRARASAVAQIGTGLRTLRVAADIRELVGGPIAHPIEIHAESLAENGAATASIIVRSGQLALLDIRGRAPLVLDHVRKGALLAMPIEATATIPQMQAKDVLAIFGRSDLRAGTVEGSAEIHGTPSAPIATGTITTANIETDPSIPGRKSSVMRDLVVTANYQKGKASADVLGHEDSGGSLHMTVNGDPAQLASMVASLEAAHFDLAPITAFAPGIASAASGSIEGKLTINGIDPDRGDVSGHLHVAEALIPVAETLGVLRQGDVDIKIANHVITAKLDGKLGGGTVKGDATVTMAGTKFSHAEANVALRKVSPITSIEPAIDADAKATVTYKDRQFVGDVKVMNTTITIESSKGQKLLEAGAPPDMDFVDAKPKQTTRVIHRAAPSNPWLVLNIDIQPAVLTLTDVAVVQSLRATVIGKLKVSYGDGLGVDGSISTQRGDVNLFGRSYQFDRGVVTFDGSPFDPILNVRLTHDFSDLTLTAALNGRVSEVNLQLTGDPGSYTPGQLLGFFLGGEPGGDPADATKNAAAGAGVSIGSQLLFSRVNKYSPVKVDVLGYEAASDTTSAAYKVGTWISHNLFVAYHPHPNPLPDENANEALFEYYFGRHIFGGTLFLQGVYGDREYDTTDLLWRTRW